jgi:hypothetical protein
MRDIKIVGYGKVSVADELKIGTALEELGIDRVQIYSVNHLNERLTAQARVIQEQNVLLEKYVLEIEELKKDG